MRVFLLLLVAFSINCVSYPPPVITVNSTKYPNIIRWSTFRPNAAEQWLKEAQKRWKDPVVFVCHGGYRSFITTDSNGKDELTFVWVISPDRPRMPMPVSVVAQLLHNMYPKQDVVLITCNEKQQDIFVPRVWYARTDVWQVPDTYATNHEKLINFGCVGNINEFITEGRADTAKNAD